MEYGKVKTIRLSSDSLIKLAQSAANFNGRLAEIVDEYNAILALTDVPEFTAAEKVALGELLIGVELSRSKVQGLYLDVLDLGNEFLSESEKDQLAKKLKGLTAAQVAKIKNMISK